MSTYIDELVPAIAPHVEMDAAEVRELIATPPDPELGDFAFPCFKLAKALHRPPAAIAEDLAARIVEAGLPARFDRVEAVGPFVNFGVDAARRAQSVLDAVRSEGERYGSGTDGVGKTVVMDYSHPNIAKPFGIGHLRSTVIGGALYRIHKFLGWNAVGVNHLGDWGTQFGKLITAFRRWGHGNPAEQSIEQLYDLYVRFHREVEDDPGLEEEGRAWHRSMEDGDEEALALWRGFRQASLTEFKRIYEILEVDFDSWAGESFYIDRLDDAVRLAIDKGVATEDDGAIIVDFHDDQLGVWLLRKSDGATLYSTRDLAAAIYRAEAYHFDKLLYVVGAPQARHFAQLFETLRLMGYEWWDRCVHVSFGQILGMSTRKGTLVFLDEVVTQAVERVARIIEERNPELDDKEDIARKVGIGAIVFADLSRRRIRDYQFDWEEILSFDGETGPYVQYTHARLCSILRKYDRPVPPAYDPGLYPTPEEAACVRGLEAFPEAVRQAADEHEPYFIAHYLIELATVANAFYQKHRVIDPADERLESARIVLVDALRQVLGNGLRLLGVHGPERM